jgi:hypothetical protein
MHRRFVAVLTVIAALCLSTPIVMAKGGKSKANDHAKAHAEKHVAKEHKQGHGDHRWERRDGFEHAIFERGGRPPGWSRGKKTGWGNCGVPPGHAKKGECRYYVYQRRRHYYYLDDDRIIVRRPAVHVHAGVDIVR